MADDLIIRILVKALNEASPVLSKVQADLNKLRTEDLKTEGQRIKNATALERLESAKLTRATKTAAIQKKAEADELAFLRAREGNDKRLAREAAQRQAGKLAGIQAVARAEKEAGVVREAANKKALAAQEAYNKAVAAGYLEEGRRNEKAKRDADAAHSRILRDAHSEDAERRRAADRAATDSRKVAAAEIAAQRTLNATRLTLDRDAYEQKLVGYREEEAATENSFQRRAVIEKRYEVTRDRLRSVSAEKDRARADLEHAAANGIIDDQRRLQAEYKRSSAEVKRVVSDVVRAEKDLAAAQQGSGGDNFIDRRLRGTLSSLKEFGNEIKLAQFKALGLVAFLPYLITLFVSLGAVLASVAGAAGAAAIAIGGALTAAVGAALPGVGLLIGAFAELKQVLKISQDQQKASIRDAIKADKAQKDSAGLARTTTNAKRGLIEAEKNLDEARKQAVKNLRDQIQAEQDAALAAQGSSLSLAEAKKALGQAIREGRVDDIARLQLQIAQSEQDLKRSKTNATDAAQKARLGKDGGIEGDAGVLAAKKSLVAARDQVAAAQDSEAKAADRTASAYAKVNEQIRRLTPGQRKLLASVNDLKKAYADNIKPLLEPILASFSKFARGIAKLFRDPDIKKALKDLGVDIGHSIDRFTTFLTGKEGKEFILQSVKELRSLLPALTDTAISLARIFFNISAAAGPLLRAIVGQQAVTRTPDNANSREGRGTRRSGIAGAAQDLEKLTSNQDRLTKFFDRMGKSLREVSALLAAFARALIALLAPSVDSGNNTIDGLTQSLNDLTKWARSPEGRKAIEDFFKDSRKFIKDFGDTALPILRHFKRALEIVNDVVGKIGVGGNVVELALAFGIFNKLGAGLPLKGLEKLLGYLGKLSGPLLLRGLKGLAAPFAEFIKLRWAYITENVLPAISTKLGNLGSKIFPALGRAVGTAGTAIRIFAAESLIPLAIALAPFLITAGLIIGVSLGLAYIEKRFHFLRRAADFLKEKAKEVAAYFSGKWGDITEAIAGPLGAAAKKIYKFFSENLGKIYDDYLKPFVDEIQNLGTQFNNLFKDITGVDLFGVISRGFDVAKGLAKDLVAYVKDLVLGFKDLGSAALDLVGVTGNQDASKLPEKARQEAAKRGPSSFGSAKTRSSDTKAIASASAALKRGDTAAFQTGLTGFASKKTTTEAGPGGGVGDDQKDPTAAGYGPIVSRAIRAANFINSAHLPYVWGGGHGTPGVPTKGPRHKGGKDVTGPGFDCSGAVSAILYAAGIVKHGGDAASLTRFGHAAKGNEAIVIYARGGGDAHTVMQIDGRYFGTNQSNPGGGAGWFDGFNPNGYVKRAPQGFWTGGLVGGRGYRPPSATDTVPALLTPGEMVLTRKDQKNPIAAVARYSVSQGGYGGFATGGKVKPDWVPSEYWPLIVAAAQKQGIDPVLFAALLKQESGFNPKAYNKGSGASGIAQFLPSTFNGLPAPYNSGSPFNARDGIRSGGYYLGNAIKHNNGNVNNALASYNAGQGNVDKYGGVPPFKETQNYVRVITGTVAEYYKQHPMVDPKTKADAATVSKLKVPGVAPDPAADYILKVLPTLTGFSSVFGEITKTLKGLKTGKISDFNLAMRKLLDEGGLLDTLSNAITSRYTQALRKIQSSQFVRTLVQTGGLGVARTGPLRRNEHFDPATDQVVDDSGAAQATVKAVQQQRQGLVQQRGVANQTLEAAKRRVADIRKKLKTAKGSARTGLLNQLQDAQAKVVKAGGAVTASTDAINQNSNDLLTAQEGVRTAAFDRINSGATAAITRANNAARIADASGNPNAQGDLLDATLQAQQNQKTSLQKLLAGARRKGDAKLIKQITDQLSDLDASIAETTTAKFENAIQVVQDASSRVLGRADIGRRIATAFGKGDEATIQFLNIESQQLQTRRAGIVSVLAAAIAAGNGKAAQEAQAAIDEIDAGIAENIGSRAAAALAAIQNDVNGKNSTLDLKKQILANGGTIDGLSGVSGQSTITQSELSNQSAANAKLLANYEAAKAQFGNENVSTVTRDALNAYLQGIIASQELTKAITDLNGSLHQSQDFASSSWTYFRAAVFNGTGGLLPQYSQLVPTMAGGGRIMSDGMAYLHANETVVPARVAPWEGGSSSQTNIINIDQAGQDLDPAELSRRIAWEIK